MNKKAHYTAMLIQTTGQGAHTGKMKTGIKASAIGIGYTY